MSEDIKKRVIEIVRERHIGLKNPQWKGDLRAPGTGRVIANRLYPNPQPCEVCGELRTEKHHIDNNPINNASNNIMWLCRKHHMKVDGRLSRRGKDGRFI